MDPAIEKVFAELASSLESFSAAKNLLIEKYYHDSPSWRFSFRHPEHGVGSVDISIAGIDEFSVWGYWWTDNYDEGTRRLRSESFGLANKEASIETLEKALTAVLNWDPESLISHDGYKQYWHKAYSKQEFAAFGEKYPTLK